jgi:hypothetical protein
VVEGFKAYVCGRSLAGVAGPNPAGGMDVCVVCVVQYEQKAKPGKSVQIKYRDRTKKKSPVVSLGIFSEATDGTMCPGVDSASKNEYQENSWG